MTSLLPTSSSTSTPHQVVPFTGSFGGPGHTDFMAEFGRVGSKGKKRKTIVTAEERERRNKMARENGWRNYTMANELILKEGTKKQKETLAKQERKNIEKHNKKMRKNPGFKKKNEIVCFNCKKSKCETPLRKSTSYLGQNEKYCQLCWVPKAREIKKSKPLTQRQINQKSWYNSNKRKRKRKNSGK